MSIASFNKDRLVMLSSLPSKNVETLSLPRYVASAYEPTQYDTETERAQAAQNNRQNLSVTERIMAERDVKRASIATQNLDETPADEHSCVNAFFEGTSIKKPCEESAFSDNVPNPLREKLLTNFTVDAKLFYFKH